MPGNPTQPAVASEADLAFRARFEAGEVGPSDFDHRAHLRLAYVVLCDPTVQDATAQVRACIQAFLARHAIDPSKYHETLTAAWLAAVQHFMDRSPDTTSFDALIARDPRLLDPDIMLTHYSGARLFSAEARATFIAPDRDPIPPRARSADES